MTAISQTTISNAFSWMKLFVFRFKFQFIPKGPINNMTALVQIMARRRMAPSHHLNQWWPMSLTHKNHNEWFKCRSIGCNYLIFFVVSSATQNHCSIMSSCSYKKLIFYGKTETENSCRALTTETLARLMVCWLNIVGVVCDSTDITRKRSRYHFMNWDWILHF